MDSGKGGDDEMLGERMRTPIANPIATPTGGKMTQEPIAFLGATIISATMELVG